MTYPQQLPEKPEGWTRSLICHFNYGTWTGKNAAYVEWAPLPTRAAKGAE